jgi:hypothetical protein
MPPWPPGFEPEKRAMANHIQRELAEAKRIQQQLGCTWTQALRLAYRPTTKP